MKPVHKFNLNISTFSGGLRFFHKSAGTISAFLFELMRYNETNNRNREILAGRGNLTRAGNRQKTR